jgi:hypothetical protein
MISQLDVNVIVAAFVPESLEMMFLTLRRCPCNKRACLYLEQVLREVLYMHLYAHDRFGITVSDMDILRFRMKVTLEEFTRGSCHVPVCDSNSFGKEIVGVMCVDAKTSIDGFKWNYFKSGLRRFLRFFCQGVIQLQHSWWEPVAPGILAAIDGFVSMLDVADMAVLRSLAVGMLAQVRVAILRGWSERRAFR